MLKTSRGMVMFIYLLQALIVSGTIVCVTYYLMRVAAYCVLWLIELSFKPSDDPQRCRPNALSHVTEDVVRQTTACVFDLKKRTVHLSNENADLFVDAVSISDRAAEKMVLMPPKERHRF